MKLIKPSIEYKESYIEALKEGFSGGEGPKKSDKEINQITQNFEQHLISMQDNSGKIKCEDGKEYNKVPQDIYWLIDDNKFIGNISFRKKLNSFLTSYGGNIGYAIRPSCKKQGYATKMLNLLLEKIDIPDLKEVLITCDPDNIGSNKVIQNNGGKFLGEKQLDWRPETPINHYKIKL